MVWVIFYNMFDVVVFCRILLLMWFLIFRFFVFVGSLFGVIIIGLIGLVVLKFLFGVYW